MNSFTYDELSRLLLFFIRRSHEAVAADTPDADRFIAAAILVSQEMQRLEAIAT